jgi:hypothetical protein
MTNANEMDMLVRQLDVFRSGGFVPSAGEEYYLSVETCGSGAPEHRKDAARVALKNYGGGLDDFPRGK